MSNKKKILVGKMACVLGVIPVLMVAHEYGPDPYHTSAPGDNATSCIKAQCHVGKLNSFSGNVKISAADGSTYTPGATQKILVTITDTTQKSWGFQVTARLAKDPQNTQAGDFNSPDGSTFVQCGDSHVKTANRPCSDSIFQQFAQHTQEGWTASRGKVGSYSYSVDWTAPSTNVGDVMFYVGANASNSTNSAGGGHIYTANLKLSALVDSGKKPAIISGKGVVNAATNLATSIAANTYITIYGSDLANTTRLWGGADFGASGAALPNSLSGTSVTVNGIPAFVEYVSPTQVNAITPNDSSTGSGIDVVVSRNGQSSDASSVTMTALSPGFFTFDGKYVAAADTTTGNFIGKTGLFASAPALTTPAKPGQLVTLYGTGFGPTSPAIAPGIVTDQLYSLSPVPVISVGGSPAAIGYAGLAPGFAQVYQFNITVPSNAPDGDLQIFSQSGGVTSPNSAACCFITVKR